MNCAHSYWILFHQSWVPNAQMLQKVSSFFTSVCDYFVFHIVANVLTLLNVTVKHSTQFIKAAFSHQEN